MLLASSASDSEAHLMFSWSAWSWKTMKGVAPEKQRQGDDSEQLGISNVVWWLDLLGGCLPGSVSL